MYQVEQELRFAVMQSGKLIVELAEMCGADKSTLSRFRKGGDLGWDKSAVLLRKFGRTIEPGGKSPLEIREVIKAACKSLASDRPQDTGITELAKTMARRKSDVQACRVEISKFLGGRNCGVKKVAEIAKAAGIVIK
jgi:hypothetical protein